MPTWPEGAPRRSQGPLRLGQLLLQRCCPGQRQAGWLAATAVAHCVPALSHTPALVALTGLNRDDLLGALALRSVCSVFRDALPSIFHTTNKTKITTVKWLLSLKEST